MNKIYSLLTALLNNKFIKNVSVLMSGTILAHIITVIGIPITTRLFSPESFSTLSIYASTLSILLAFATLNLHLGVPVEHSRRDALSLVAVSTIVLLFFTVALSTFLLLFGRWFANLINRPDFAPYLFLLLPGFLFGGAYTLLQMWFSREKNFKLIARTRVIRSIGGTGTQLTFGIAHSSPFGLIFGHMIYTGLGAVALLSRFLYYEIKRLTKLANKDLRNSLSRNYRYATYTTPENLANVAGIQLPILIISSNPAAGEVGHLYLALSIMMLPMMLIGSSVGQVFIAHAPDKYRTGNAWNFTLGVLRGLVTTGAPLLVFAGFAAPILAEPILGEEWKRTGELIAWMTPWIVLQFLASPLSTIFYVAGLQKEAAVLQLSGLLIRVGSLMIVMNTHPKFAMEAYALSGGAFYLVMLLAVLYVAKGSKHE